MLAYKQIEDPKRLLECCDHDPSKPPPAGDCCYDVWTTDLTNTSGLLKRATTRAEHKQKEYDSISAWYTTLKAWCDDWERMDHLADTMCRNFELFIRHLRKVGEITEQTGKAIDILFCMIRELYWEVDILKERYDDLYKCINCLKSPELESGGIRTCLDAYGVKLLAVIATRDDLINKVIVAIEPAYGLHNNISDEYGLLSVLEYWKRRFNCDGSVVQVPERHEERRTERSERREWEERRGGEEVEVEEQVVFWQEIEYRDYHGRDRCYLRPMITFPIDQDHYVRELREHRDETRQRLQELKSESAEANEQKAALQACASGLTNAIQSIDSSGKCK